MGRAVCTSHFYIKEMNSRGCWTETGALGGGGSELSTPGPLSPPRGSLVPLHRAQVGNNSMKVSGSGMGSFWKVMRAQMNSGRTVVWMVKQSE